MISSLTLSYEVLPGGEECNYIHVALSHSVEKLIYMRQPSITGLTENSLLALSTLPFQKPAPSQMWKLDPGNALLASQGLAACLGFTFSQWSQCWYHRGRSSLVPSHICVVHLPLWTCLTAFLHGRGDFLFSSIPLSALISVDRLWCPLCWRRQPWQERTFNLFPRTEPWEAVSAPRHNSLGSSPKNALSSTRLLSNICLPPVWFKLATSVPLALSTCARNGAESFQNLQTGWWRMFCVSY